MHGQHGHILAPHLQLPTKSSHVLLVVLEQKSIGDKALLKDGAHRDTTLIPLDRILAYVLSSYKIGMYLSIILLILTNSKLQGVENTGTLTACLFCFLFYKSVSLSMISAILIALDALVNTHYTNPGKSSLPVYLTYEGWINTGQTHHIQSMSVPSPIAYH